MLNMMTVSLITFPQTLMHLPSATKALKIDSNTFITQKKKKKSSCHIHISQTLDGTKQHYAPAMKQVRLLVMIQVGLNIKMHGVLTNTCKFLLYLSNKSTIAFVGQIYQKSTKYIVHTQKQHI